MSSYNKRYIDYILKALRDRVEDVRSSSDSNSMDYHTNMLRDISILSNVSQVKHSESVNQVKHDVNVKQSDSSQTRSSASIDIIDLILGIKRSESVEVESRRGRGRKVLRVSDVVRILYEYYVLERKQKEIAERYGVSQGTVSYYVVKYRKYVYRVIDKCESTGIVNYAECFNKNMRIIVLANHRKRKSS